MKVPTWIRRGQAAALALMGTIALSITGGAAQASSSAGFYRNWAWFENTYWIVPPEGIYSVFHIQGDNKFVVDRGQTVFHITDYFNGYFTGAVVVKLTERQIVNCQYVLGQVTPEGRVFMTMYNADPGSQDVGQVVNYPLGQMVKRGKNWTMVNTMTSLAQGGTLSHWAYMVQAKPGTLAYNDLPFAHVSIPEFMSSCPAGPQIENAFD